MTDHSLVVCRCEEVTLDEIKHTLTKYQCSDREIKLRTRAGMGYCGGRTCRVMIDALMKELVEEMPNEIPLKHQPPVRPVSFGLLGGEVKK